MILFTSPQMVALFAALSIAAALETYRRFRNDVKSIDNFPGMRTLFGPNSNFAQFLPDIPGVIQNRKFKWQHKYNTFQEIGWDVYSHVSIWPTRRITYAFADAEAIKEFALKKAVFPKPRLPFIELYGSNVVGAGDEEWKRHRKISAPAFSERNNKLVWQETARIVDEVFAEWGDEEIISIENVTDLTLPITLLVISAAGFGRRVPWREETNASIPAGHIMSFKQSITIVCHNLFLKAIIPEWMMGLTKKWAQVRDAFRELETYMQEMIDERQKNTYQPDEEDHNTSDLFTNLITASEEELASGTPSLTPRELIGNVFIFLLAGHETTGHSLAFTFGLLACYPDEQQKLYDHIKSVLSDERSLSYEDMHSLTRSLAVFYEALRMFPIALSTIKRAGRDITLSVHASTPQSGYTKGSDSIGDLRKTIVVPRGSVVSLHMPGVHYNPRYWEDPYEFKPDRFLGSYNKDAFIPFAVGVRACLGRRFSETEAVAIITMMVLRYKIEPNPDLFTIIPGETPRVTSGRLLKEIQNLTLAPERLPLLFKRRT